MSSKKKSVQISKETKKLGYFDYDVIVGIDFGNTFSRYCVFRTKEGDIRSGSGYLYLSGCLYYCENNDYDNATFECLGDRNEETRTSPTALYVNDLIDKLDYLFNKEPDIDKPLKSALDRLYQRALIQYFEELVKDIIKNIRENSFAGKSLQIRYVITYPSYWIPEKVAYLRSLIRMAGIIDERGDPDRLIMCNEGEAIFCYLQEPYRLGAQIRTGQKYLICDMGGSKVKMSLCEIKHPLEIDEDINPISRCDWNLACGEKPFQLDVGAEDIGRHVENYLLSKISTESRKISLEDFHHEDGVLYDEKENFKKFVERLYFRIQHYWKEDITDNYPEGFTLYFPTQSDQSVSTTPENLYLSDSNTSLNEIYSEISEQFESEEINYEFYPSEIDEKVVQPLFTKIVQYIEEVMQAASDFIDGIIFVGGLRENEYLMELITDACSRTGTKFFNEECRIEEGAILKFVWDVGAREFKPEIAFDNEALSPSQTQDIYIFIDYGLEKTKISYICAPPGVIADDANIKHIKDWPGQSLSNIDLSTLDVMLISRCVKLNVINRIAKYVKSSYHYTTKPSSNDRKWIVCMENRTDHHEQYLKYTGEKHAKYGYYTFEKDEQGIILVIHRSSKVEKEPNRGVEDQISIDENAMNVTRKRIWAREFTLLYFEHLTAFIYDYFKSRKSRFRFCITRDSQARPDELKLSDDDIYEIAYKSKMIAKDSPNTLLVLERAQATAIHCRTMIDTSNVKKGESYIHFLQVHLHPDRCVLILNDIPLSDDNENSTNKENGEPWESICKYAKIKDSPIDIMDKISEYLWNHIQKYQNALLQRCERHKSQGKFFTLSNMQVFKKMLRDYISKKTLDLKNRELEQEIHICDNTQENCRLTITNVDLLDFCIVPAINRLISLLQASISNKSFSQDKQISDIFVMGKFLDCQDHASYSFLEHLLLSNKEKINFQSSDRKDAVTKFNGLEKQPIRQVINEVKGYKSIELASMKGSILYGLDPRNRLVERVVDRTYGIGFCTLVIKFLLCDDKVNEPLKFGNGDLVPIIKKGASLASFTSVEDEISKVFMVEDGIENQMYDKTDISLHLSEQLIPDLEFKHQSNTASIDCMETLSFEKISALPFTFKARMPQTTPSYEFWVEYGINEKEYFKPLKERIMLKSLYHYK